MQKFMMAVDRLTTYVGRLFAWSIAVLTLLVSWEVFSRYVLNHPHPWALDAQIMLYGTLFMMAGAYTLAHQGHVRGDVLYGALRPRTQAGIDLVLFIFFYLPGRCIPSSSSSRRPASCCCCRASSRSCAAWSACAWAAGPNG